MTFDGYPITPCPECGSEESVCGYDEVPNLKGELTGLKWPFVHIERLWAVRFTNPLPGPESNAG